MACYVLGFARNFAARHYFLRKDGPEGLPHAHQYRMEVRLHGDELDGNGYLIDLDHVESLLKTILVRYADVLLNELPEFSDAPPSLEHLSKLLCRAVCKGLNAPTVKAVTLKLWENEWAWASFHEERE